MPYSPPCCDDEHTSIVCPCSYLREDIRVEKEDESESGILNACLDGDCPSVLIWQLHQGAGSESDAEGEKIVQEHDQEDILDACHEDVEIALEDDYHHSDEHDDGEVLQRLLQDLGNFRQILSAEDTQDKRNTHDDEYALENISERNLKLRENADVAVSCEIEVHLTPESEVQRRREYAGSSIECCE